MIQVKEPIVMFCHENTGWKYIKDRRYDAGGDHIAPNDETQQDVLDLFHDIYFRALGDKLFLAPIAERPHRVLDCGTGTGIWAIDFADTHLSAEVIGNDLSPIQPRWVPPNCKFEVDDFTKPWTYTANSFDFIHGRALHGSVGDWGEWCAQAFKALKPGGWLEIVDEDVDLHCDDKSLPEMTPTRFWLDENKRVLKDQIKRTAVPYTELKERMTSAGFDMATWKQVEFPVPIGTWPKDKKLKGLGGMMLANMLQGIDGWSRVLWTQLMDKTEEEYQKLLAGWKYDLRDKKQHKYMKIHVTYAQKPL